MKTCLLLLALALPLAAHARIGETREQIVKRFGNPISKPSAQQWIWEPASLIYIVLFDAGGKSIGESIGTRSGDKLTDGQFREFLLANVPDEKSWHRVVEKPLDGPFKFGKVQIDLNPLLAEVYFEQSRKLLARKTRSTVWIYTEAGAELLATINLEKEKKDAVKF